MERVNPMALVDLTHPLRTDIPVFPGDPEVSFSDHCSFDEDGYRVRSLQLGSHSGTHIDAPSHTEEEGNALDDYEPEDFRFEARLIDVRPVESRSPLGPSVLPGESPGNTDLYLFYTGWADHWGTNHYYDHPYLHPDSARICADRNVSVGLDVLSPDPSYPYREGADTDAEDPGIPAHHALLGSGQFILENLRGLEELPDRFTVHAYPLRLDADGSPVRVVAEM